MHLETHPPEGAYDDFAPFYDDFIAFCDYEAWTDSVEPLLRAAPRPGGGCWTSPAARARACAVPAARIRRDRVRRLRGDALRRPSQGAGAALYRADLRTLPVIGHFDVLTCFGDCLNYLASADELAAAFRSARRNLAPGGVLAFD